MGEMYLAEDPKLDRGCGEMGSSCGSEMILVVPFYLILLIPQGYAGQSGLLPPNVMTIKMSSTRPSLNA
jgi:hypothetical protein